MTQYMPYRKSGFAVSADTLPREAWDDASCGTGTWRTLICGDRASSDSIVAGLAEFGPCETLNPHRHSQPEVYFGVGGDGVVTIDGKPHVLQPGTAIFIPGDVEHSVVAGAQGVTFFYSFPTNRFGEVDYQFSGA